jgi:hypothetical protein
MRSSIHRFALASLLFGGAALPSLAQPGGSAMPDSVKAKRWATENELQSLATVERKIMITMRDGIRIAADIYHPQDGAKKYPAIWVRTPYNFNYWDITNGVPRDMTAALTAIKHGYAYVDMQERGHFFSEGNYDILGAPISDGDDELSLLAIVVERQNRHDGLFVDRRVAAGGCLARESGVRGDERAGVRRRHRPRRRLLRAGQLVSRRRGADVVHRLARR